MSGVMKAPPRTDIYVLWGNYGALSGAETHPRGRLWILAEHGGPDAGLLCRIAWNRKTGGVEYQDLGPVTAVVIKRNVHAEVTLASGARINLVAAPCVCGAGAVGNAMPAEGRLSVHSLNLHARPEVRLL
jgi:hypothetical protein